jgi:hypothetical protein
VTGAHDPVTDLIAHLESHGLSASGSGADYTITRDGGQATHADRELVLEWAKQRSDVAELRVSDLVDLGEVI